MNVSLGDTFISYGSEKEFANAHSFGGHDVPILLLDAFFVLFRSTHYYMQQLRKIIRQMMVHDLNLFPTNENEKEKENKNENINTFFTLINDSDFLDELLSCTIDDIDKITDRKQFIEYNYESCKSILDYKKYSQYFQ